MKHNLSDEHLHSARKEMEDETMERAYDSEEEYYFLTPKTNSKGASSLFPQPKMKGPRPRSPNLKIKLKILLKLNPSLYLKLKLKIVSTLQLSMNVENVMEKLEIKEP